MACIDRRLLIVLEILAILVVAPGLVFAQPNAAGSLPPGVGIRAEAIPSKATVGDLIQIDLDISLPPGYQARIPKPGNTGDFSIVDFAPGPQIPEKDGSQQQGKHHKARVTAAVYKTGTFVFPPFAVLLKTDKGTEIGVLSPPVSVEIRSVLSSTDQNLKDLKKQVDIKESRNWLLWIGLLLAICLLVFFIRRMQRRRGPRSSSFVPAGDPLESAGADLRRLLARGLPEPGKEKEFYILLSDIIKRIVEIGYGIHTAEQTTSEIVEGLRGRTEGEKLERIESFLLRCDMVKFAKYVPSKNEQESVCADALGILKTVASRQSLVASETKNTVTVENPMTTGD